MLNANVVWALVSGLAVGYIAGNVLPIHGVSPAATAKDGDAISAVPGETIPANWITEKAMGATDLFAGLTPSQRFLALKVLNNKPCSCGCAHGTIAACKKEDPACPDAPKEVETAVREARAGKSYDEIFAAVQHPPASATQPGGAPKRYRATLAEWTPVLGPKNAKVTIVAFSDFECPFCAAVEPTLKQVVDAYPNDVRIAWRNAPSPAHTHAVPAAEAAMAANAQGKFWPMHDKLFANQKELDRSGLDADAKAVGLDLKKYATAMDTHAFLAKVEDDYNVAVGAGLAATPTFYINGQYMIGAQTLDALKTVIDAEITKANALLAAGTPPEKLYDAELDALASAPAGDSGAH